MLYLVQTGIKGDLCLNMLSYLDYSERKVFTFNSEDLNNFDNFLLRLSELEGPFQVYSTVNFLKLIEGTRYYPCTGFRFTNQYEELKEIYNDLYLNSGGKVLSIRDINVVNDVIIKPISDKQFHGRIFTPENVLKFKNELNDGFYKDLNMDSKVLCKELDDLKREVRFWIVNKEIITQSTYVVNKKVVHDAYVPLPMIDFAHSIKTLGPWLGYTLDIAEVEENGHIVYKVIEVNCINTSGLYCAEEDKIVKALENINQTLHNSME